MGLCTHLLTIKGVTISHAHEAFLPSAGCADDELRRRRIPRTPSHGRPLLRPRTQGRVLSVRQRICGRVHLREDLRRPLCGYRLCLRPCEDFPPLPAAHDPCGRLQGRQKWLRPAQQGLSFQEILHHPRPFRRQRRKCGHLHQRRLFHQERVQGRAAHGHPVPQHGRWSARPADRGQAGQPLLSERPLPGGLRRLLRGQQGQSLPGVLLRPGAGGERRERPAHGL